MRGRGSSFRHHLRTVVSATVAPYGYTLSVWTAGALTVRQAGGFPSTVDVLLFVAGAVLGFGVLTVLVFGGVNDVLTPSGRAEVRVWGGLHLPALGTSVLLSAALVHLVHGHLAWPSVGFAATASYLVGLAGQYWLASRRTGHGE